MSSPPLSNQLHVQSNTNASPPSSSEEDTSQQCNENTSQNPTQCRVQSPQERNAPPSNTNRMNQHNVIESLLKSSSSSSAATSPRPSLSPSLSLPPRSSRMPIQTSREDDINFNYAPSSSSSRSSSNSKSNNSKKQYQQQQQKHTSAASLVVCGVDGTVFTLDAYTGQLRGMFASGPALVYSSNDIPKNKKNENEAANENSNEYDDNSLEYDELQSSSSVISTSRRPWKERVVPGLDGRLYSLYEQPDDGEDDYQNEEEEEEDYASNCHRDMENDDFIDELCNSHEEDNNLKPDSSNNNGISPRRMDQYNLQPLPISVMDVVDSPISTCRPVMEFDETFVEGVQRQQQCGIVVGSKKTTIYAIDPMTGNVRWTQDPHGGGGAKGFTTGRPADAARGKPRTVLLQREDYAVRHLDTDGGDEVWKVELGRFSALDFDIDAHNHHRQNHEMDDDGDERIDDPVVVGGRRRGAAAAAAAAATKEKQKQKVPPILGGGSKKKFGSFKDEPTEFDSDEEFDFKYDHSNFRAFPSIAFGEDGTSILAVDSISGVLLWKQQIESVVAAVYGVGKASTWVPLDVIDESDVLPDGHTKGTKLLVSSSEAKGSHSGGGLVPYGSNQGASEQSHRLGRHRDHLFVSSKLDSLGINPPPFPEPDMTDGTPDYIDEHDIYYDEVLPPKQAPLFGQAPYSMPSDVTPPVSHRTEHGLYLTWSMVSAIFALLLGLIVYARMYYLRQKKKWENTPTLAPTAPNSYEDHTTDQSMSPRGNFLSPASFVENKRSFPGTPWWKISSQDKVNTQPPSRSLSLGAIGRQAENAGKSFIPEKSSDSPLAALSPNPNPVSLFRDGKKGIKSLAGDTTTVSPTITRSLTVPPDDEQSKQPDVDNIDGVPLVRYSRYRSEFKELSALGRGGFGTVFKCENALDSREYAIKKIWIKSQMLDGKLTKHFSQKLHRVLREVKILALLDHPNIVRYYTAWLEVDNESNHTKIDDDESNLTSSRATPSLFSGFGSTSRGPGLIFKAGGSLFSKQNKGISSYMPKSNPLGWNNFASFRLDESKSTGMLSNVNENTLPLSADDGDDLGFEWERSDSNAWDQLSSKKKSAPTLNVQTMKEGDNESSSSDSSGVSSVDSKESTGENRDNLNAPTKDPPEKEIAEAANDKTEKKEPLSTTEKRHVLYIQMQLCSVQTLADFLGNREARMGSLANDATQNAGDCYAVDIPFALRLFSQIAHGVKYVHKQGLIHRDLKPQNCFIDDAGNAKVGDFGLSRESSTVGGISAFDESEEDNGVSLMNADHEESQDAFGREAENTAGVGTRAYASPEQMKGSNYDASTDIFSLGIILFEMCYPLYTTHERYKEFCGIRKGQFPSYWNTHIKTSFPSLHDILVQMISPTPSKRPSAADVSEHIDKMLAEYSVQSLDKSWGKKGAILLRVEADEAEGVLSATMKLIKTAAPNAIILQYGLRGQASKAIMEFAIEIANDEKGSLERISSSLRNSNMVVRQISQ